VNLIISIAKALSDLNRVRVISMLTAGELCVCQVTEVLNLATSTVSKHISILKQAGLGDARKEGRWMYYRLVDHPSQAARQALDWVRVHGPEDPMIQKDQKALDRILKMDKEHLCRNQRKG
jgi:ArsR family transcriptional regulator, arsenate/arsenite/antimonite-responsive transcriptional repressor